MPVTDLPFEILSKIASKLDYATVMQCCLVCKAFVDPFQELLWRDIRISSQEQLDIICNPDISEGYEKFGKLVHNLCLITRTLMTNKHLQYIQNIFPNVTKLYIHGINSGPFDCLEPSTLIPWSSVKNLDITLLGTSASAIKQDYMALLPLFPNTVDLKLNCRFEKGVTLYVEDFEIIHSSLPNLKYLLTSARLGTMTVRDMFRIPELLPAKTLEHLIGGLEDIDHRWMCYFAQKYPNLQVAKWVIDEEYDSDEEIYSEMDLIPQQVSDAYGESIVRLHDMYHSIGEDGYYHRLNRGAIYNKEEALHMFSQLSLVFPRLKTIEIYSTGETDIAGSLIQKIFGNFQVPIKHIHYFFGRNLDETGLLYKTISGFTLAFSQTIEELFLDSMISFSSLEKIAMAFESCPHLRRLEISKCNVSVDIEILMERCVSLEQIKIEGGLVGMSTDVERSLFAHGLRLLDLKDVVLIPRVLTFISRSCPMLNYMALENTQIFGQIDTNDRILIDMSFTRFKLLYINNVYFVPSLYYVERTPEDIDVTVAFKPHVGTKQKNKLDQTHGEYQNSNADFSWRHSNAIVYNLERDSSRRFTLDPQENQNICVYFHKLKCTKRVVHVSDGGQAFYESKAEIRPKKGDKLCYAVLECANIHGCEIRASDEGKHSTYWEESVTAFGINHSDDNMTSIFDCHIEI